MPVAPEPVTSNQRSPWFIVLYEWQGCQQMTADAAWWPSAEIMRVEAGALATIERLHRGEQPRRGQLTYRNIRGPFPWAEQAASVPETPAEPLFRDVFQLLGRLGECFADDETEFADIREMRNRLSRPAGLGQPPCPKCGCGVMSSTWRCTKCGANMEPRQPDNAMVICPGCTHQFPAISVNDQAHRRALQEHIAWAWAIIANVSGGDWKQQSDLWERAAAAWERARNPYAGLENPVAITGAPSDLFFRRLPEGVDMPPEKNETVEQEIQRKGLTAARVTPERLEEVIKAEQYHVFYGTTLTICCLLLANGFTVTGESACASPENFDAALGKRIARDNAKQKIWALEGYALRERLHLAEVEKAASVQEFAAGATTPI